MIIIKRMEWYFRPRFLTTTRLRRNDKSVEFNTVIPCTHKEMKELTRAGHVCIPTKWVLTDKNEHLVGTPGYTPKTDVRGRLVACALLILRVPKHPKGVPDP